MNKNNHGGERQGAGRHLKYGEPTEYVGFACPVSKKDQIKKALQKLLQKWEVKKKKNDIQDK